MILTSENGLAEGRPARPARHARTTRGAVLEDPTARAGEDDDRRAAVPLLGLRAFRARTALNSTYVLRQRFDPEETLRATASSGATALIVVPVMMQRILELPDEVIARYDLSRLRVTAASGSALPGARDRVDGHLRRKPLQPLRLDGGCGATIATPQDLRAAPGTAGRPPHRTKVRIVDHDGRDVEPGKTGRVFVGNEMAFEGYTGGGTKDELGGLMSSGDVGHFDVAGRLFIDGRDDEMIVSGERTCFPRGRGPARGARGDSRDRRGGRPG